MKYVAAEKKPAHMVGQQSELISFEVEAKAAVPRTERLGVNLGNWNSFAAQQYASNVLMNPGFEGRIDRILVLITRTDKDGFSDEAGLGYPDDYWKGASFEGVTGPLAVQRGTIKKSLNSGAEGFPQYFTNEPLHPLKERDILILTKLSNPSPPDLWQANAPHVVSVDSSQHPPKSPGKQSVRLVPTERSAAEVFFELDAIPERAGKLLPVEGKWRYSVWAKADKPGATLRILFQRQNGTKPFLDKVVATSTEWQLFRGEFDAADSGPPAILRYSLAAAEPGIAVWVDDVELGPAQKTQLPFRDEVIEALMFLRPSYLRNFSLTSDTWENRISPSFARRTWIFHAVGRKEEAIFGYSLPDFLTLCETVGANPWIVVPATFTDAEYKKTGEYLAEHASTARFAEVLVEFGSENWNWLFRPTAIPYEKEHGDVAKRAFDSLEKAAKKKVNLRAVVNGPYDDPSLALQFLDSTPSADVLAVAPYFFNTLNKATPDAEVLKQLFKEDRGFLKEIADGTYVRDKRLSVYELNLHTTKGDAKAFERNRVVAGAASGSALAQKALECLYAEAHPVMINTLSQYDTPTWDIPDFVRLWGITRDLGPPVMMRPTGLAVAMLNQVVTGSMHRLKHVGAADDEHRLTMAAFKGEKGWTAAAVSKAAIPLDLEILFPEGELALPQQLLVLASSSPFETNEFQENVAIKKESLQTDGRTVRFTIQPYGFVVLKGAE